MANVTFTYNPVPAPACYPPDLNGLAQELTSGGILSGTIPDTAGGGLASGSTPPSSALANKVWLKTDVAGRPLGLYAYYNGNWRRIYTGVSVGEIRMIWYAPSQFDGTGRATVGSDWDGWAICNGNNGTPLLNDRMPTASSNYNGTYGGWYTNIEGTPKATGGTAQHFITDNDLPPLSAAATCARYGALGGTAGCYLGNPGDPVAEYYEVVGLSGNPVGQNRTPLPPSPYFAIGFVMFVGYA